MPAVGRPLAQAVEVAVGQLRQPLVARVPEDLELAVHHRPRGGVQAHAMWESRAAFRLMSHGTRLRRVFATQFR